MLKIIVGLNKKVKLKYNIGMSEQFYKDFFEEALNQIHEEYLANGKENEFKLWFNLNYVEDTIDTITVSVASEFMWERMKNKGNVEKIQQTINELTGQNITINHIVLKASPKPEPVPVSVNLETSESKSIYMEETNVQQSKKEVSSIEKQPEVSSSQKPDFVKSLDTLISQSAETKKVAVPKKHPQLIESFTFENFIPGDNSQYAYSASLVAAKEPGNQNYNPIFLYGGVGLGKTHLMVSIGNYIYEKNPDAKICYISTESFMNEFTSAIRDKTTQKFTKKYRNLDVFLLDDIQFLEGKEALQNELFYTFNEIYDRKGQLVFTCDRPISEVKGITDRLRSRFAFGQTIDLKLPDYETRRAILEKKMSQANKSIPADVIDFIAKNVQSNVRELEACLKKMIGYADLVGKDITLQIAQEQLRDTISTPVSGTITVETIQKAVAEHFGITVANLKSSKRDKKFAFPRQVAFYIAKQQTECSLKDIGEEFGGRDHTTVLHGIDKIEKLLKYDASLDATLKHLVRDIKEFKN